MATTLWNRAILALQPGPAHVRTPRPALWLGEVLSVPGRAFDWLVPVPVSAAREPRPVLLLPGFLAHPASMAPMAGALERAGHRVRDWGLGVNTGATRDRLDQLADRIARLSRRHGQQVALVGWSLGGIYAREAARIVPEHVHGVITMGAPFSGNRRANNAWRLYQFVTGHDVDEPPVPGDLSAKPPVPTVALWSPRDGIIDPRSARGRPGERDHAVGVRCTHLGFASDRAVIAEVLHQIDTLRPVRDRREP